MSNPFDELKAQLDKIEGLLNLLLAKEPTVLHAPEKRMNIKQAAEYLGLSVGGIYQNTDIPRHKKNNRLSFFEAELLAYLKNGGNLKSTPSEPVLTIKHKRRVRTRIIKNIDTE